MKRGVILDDETRFYGYITGLFIKYDDVKEKNYKERGLFAVFEYNDITEIWEVPDLELFNLLFRKLFEDGWFVKNTDDHGYNKLYISKKNGKWEVELP
jgi:hypothetical protein